MIQHIKLKHCFSFDYLGKCSHKLIAFIGVEIEISHLLMVLYQLNEGYHIF